MLAPVSAKRPEENAASGGVDRPVKRAKLNADFSKGDERSDVPGEYSEGDMGPIAEDSGPSDLYLDTVSPTYRCMAQMSSQSYSRLTELSLISISRKSDGPESSAIGPMSP